jgi:hypothetical protein
MQYLTSFYRHSQALHRAAQRFAALDIHVDLRDFTLRVTSEGHTNLWRPRFIVVRDGRLMYVDKWSDSSQGFVGWTPYGMRQWPESTDKLAFKRLAMDRGLRSPAACIAPGEIGGPFLIKKSRSSFGEGIRGPFVRFDPNDPQMRLSSGEYYENFILGHIVKAWYWDAKWVVVEFRAPPLVAGDGKRTFRELVLGLPNIAGRPHEWPTLLALARYCGLDSLDDVLPEGKEVIADFKYASRYEPYRLDNLNMIDKLAPDLADQFRQAGVIVSEAVRRTHPNSPSVFALDAMVDPEGNAWFLEVNSNPMIHPDLYQVMLATEVRDGIGVSV